MANVFLIGGVGGTGKTLLASKLMRRLHIPYISIDHLMMGMTRSDPDCPFSPLDSGEEIGHKMWPFLQAIIQTNVENDHSIILEGFQLQPECVTRFTPEYLQHIIPVFIGFSENYVRAMSVDIQRYRNVVEQREPDNLAIEDLVEQHAHLKQKCREYGVRFFEIDDHYTRSLDELLDDLVKDEILV
jgi:putative acetyltransferase